MNILIWCLTCIHTVYEVTSGLYRILVGASTHIYYADIADRSQTQIVGEILYRFTTCWIQLRLNQWPSSKQEA